MKRYMVRRTRSFIKDNYAKSEPPESHRGVGVRKYLEFADGRRSYFLDRIPRNIKFTLEADNDSYSRLYSKAVVEVINQLNLPRYGLGNYLTATKALKDVETDSEQRQLNGLFRGGLL
jgi:capsid portal protein